ncbi:hypothetical protein BJ878DRAFT_417212 [Calycina marina]|uniref:Uncharacterized protein n=1 Tax=Calycina marina TaxID=1763456 RepID=A0A9P7Z6R5_9HELO|nr:hypothetical protein BJ878DRAFT_417212 [Calycina marina]
MAALLDGSIAHQSASFGLYRSDNLFADGNSTSTYPQHTTLSMSQTSRPSSGQNIERTPSAVPGAAPLRSTPQGLNITQADASPGAVFGTLELVEIANPTHEGILGPNKDGRVRNPVPSKLKGKTDNMHGNFAVMSMGMSPNTKINNTSGKDMASERDAAARRTSESTASRAKAAQNDKYAPPKRRGLEGMENRGSPFGEPKQRASRPLASDETKVEQARLLTLLRSINPVTVVDQICKAVAYFGGIPGAPPPEDGIFPESANTRETGALFIGWLAEIFPNVTSPEVPKMQAPPTKKGRVRSGLLKQEPDATPAPEAPNPRNGYGFGQAVGAPAWGLPQSLGQVNSAEVERPLSTGITSGIPQTSIQHEQPQTLTPSQQKIEDVSSLSTGKKPRGRPKGSRNKCGNPDAYQDTPENGYGGQPVSMDQEGSPVTEKAMQPEPIAYTPLDRTAPTAQASQITFGDKTWQSNTQQKSQAEQEWQINNQRKLLDQSNKAAVPVMGDELSPEEQAVLEAFRGPDVTKAGPIVPQTAPAKGAAGGVKRKRGPNKPKAPLSVQEQQGNKSGHKSNSLLVSDNTGGTVVKDQMQWAPADNLTTTPPATTAPPPKRQRQRKPKAQAPSVPADSPSLSMNNSLSKPSTPKVPPSTILDSQVTSQQSTQQSTQVTRPPAEGLEAHYERFASTTSQQNGRSHTPTTTPQQQIRNQQTSSVPPQVKQIQQPSAQQQTSNHQHQMQQQKSQSSHQRDDQKVTQAAPAISSSSGFYSQRNSDSNNYNSQYSTHQPTQLYRGHQSSLSQSSLGQPSPQMNSNASNSYRSGSTNTLAQASPQFSQTEGTYRTGSPHTIAQPSPSYTQPDTTYRSSNSHTLAQPAPQYSAAENSYRSSTTHSVQPTTSYNRPSQSQPSHQSHYGAYSDTSYVDLPTLESLGHSGTSTSASVGLVSGGYAQAMGLSNVASRSGSNSLYGTSTGLSGGYDSSADLLRGISRSSVSGSAYGTSSGMGSAYDTSGANDPDMRERLMRNLGRR